MLRLGLIADIHMQDDHHGAVTSALEAAVDRIGTFDPHRTVVLGDLIEEEEDRNADLRNVDRVTDTLAPLEPRYLAGNHDVVTLDGPELVDRFGNALAGHETVEGIDLVYLDTASPGTPRWRAEVGPAGRHLLDEALAGATDALVFAHHPIHYLDVTDNRWFGEHPELAFPADKGWVTRLLADHPAARATFNGHLHVHNLERGPVDHFTINAVNKERPDSDGPTGTHALVTLDEHLRVEVYDLDGFVHAWEVPG